MKNTDSIRQMQARIADWVIKVFGRAVLYDRNERGLRLVEEAVETAQALDIPKERLHLLIDRVYERPVGELSQELGGVFVTLAAVAESSGMDLHNAAATEVARIEAKNPEHFRARNREKAALGVGNYPTGQAA